MSYTKNVYYPTEGVTDRTGENFYNAYKTFLNNNTVFNSRFNVTSDDTELKIKFIPKEDHLQNYVFDLRFTTGTSPKIIMHCPNLGLSESYDWVNKEIKNNDAPLTIIESGEFLLIEFGLNTDYPVVVFFAPGQTFLGDPTDNSVFFSFYYQNNTSLRQGSGGMNYVSVTNNPMRTCAAETGLYRLTRLSSIDNRYDRIFPDLYCIDGGSTLPAWGTPFKVGKETFLMVCKNICVKV